MDKLLRARFASLAAVAALAVSSLAVLTAPPAAVGSTPRPEGKAAAAVPVPAARAEARGALAEARALTTGGGAERDASMTLLRLWQLRGALQGAERAAADRLLARPTTTQDTCTPTICFHWATSGPDAVSPTDSDANDIPDYVDDVIETVTHVSETFLAAGYRAPRSDGLLGGGPQLDIYLEDTGAQQTYGYCTSDMPIPDPPPSYDAWAYCVLDNDFARSQFPENTPLENLQVTAAHELFHAVQYAYDAFEDLWFLESTAAWVEDEVYDEVDDNLQYLHNSPLTAPGRPLDTYGDGAHYGEWIFFRFLTEAVAESQGGLPVLVREMWELADGAPGGPDAYSMEAVEAVLDARGATLTEALSAFHTANRIPRLFYEEGTANAYPSTAPDGTFRLSRKRRNSDWGVAEVDHLAARTARFVPGRGLKPRRWRLQVSVDLPPRATQPAAQIIVMPKRGLPEVYAMRLNARGDATRKVPFGSSEIAYVEVTLTNAGARYDCWSDGDYSCQGTSLDDGRLMRVRGRAVR